MSPIEELISHYPEIINIMDKRFNSHAFILELAYQYQGLYAKSLAKYADNKAPFQVVHGILAKALTRYDQQVYYIGEEPSIDIFGHSNNAAVWGKKA